LVREDWARTIGGGKDETLAVRYTLNDGGGGGAKGEEVNLATEKEKGGEENSPDELKGRKRQGGG